MTQYHLRKQITYSQDNNNSFKNTQETSRYTLNTQMVAYGRKEHGNKRIHTSMNAYIHTWKQEQGLVATNEVTCHTQARNLTL